MPLILSEILGSCDTSSYQKQSNASSYYRACSGQLQRQTNPGMPPHQGQCEERCGGDNDSNHDTPNQKTLFEGFQ